MVKAYLRYKPSRNIGVIYSSGTSVLHLPAGLKIRSLNQGAVAWGSSPGRQLVVVGGLEQALIWDLKRGECVATLPPQDSKNDPESLAPSAPTGEINGQVTVLALVAPTVLAAGYTDGFVRLWNLETLECSVAFNGHRKAITSLHANEDGSQLASGSNDCHVIVWDVVAEQGMCRLKGHSDAVTQVRFLSRHNTVVSCSKDGFIKLWDLATQHCVQTLTGHRKEVWALAVNGEQTRMVSGCIDAQLKVWRLTTDSASSSSSLPSSSSDVGSADPRKRDRPEEPVDDLHLGAVRAEFLGELKRQGAGRVQSLGFSESHHYGSGLLYCQSSDKAVELYRVHTAAELTKRARKRRTKTRQKLGKAGKADSDAAAIADGAAAAEPPQFHPSDEYSTYMMLRAAYKVSACAFSPTQSMVTLGLVNNRIESYKLDDAGEAEKTSSIQIPGHRAGIRSLALSQDDALIASTAKELKIWSARSAECVRTIKMEEVEGVSVAFLPGNRHVVVGSKAGHLLIFEIATGECCFHDASAHESAIWSIVVHPSQRGMATGSADHHVKFWDFTLEVGEDGHKKVGLALAQSVSMSEDVMSLVLTDKFVAVALLDYTIKVFHEDSMKFFLSLYGHKLPVLSQDISDDNTLLVSGSADKNIKIWGLDFGDCHKSIFAHDGSVMQVKFVRKTHYFFSAGKDFLIKYWDADTFEHISTLKGHWGEIWGLNVSRFGDFVVSASQDRSIRTWLRTDEQVFVEEEREKEMDSLFESTLSGQRTGREIDQDAQESSLPGKRTLETIKAGEALLDALKLAQEELDVDKDYRLALELAEVRMPQEERPADPDAPLLPPPVPNPALEGRTPARHVFDNLNAIPSPFLEEALLVLPFTSVVQLLGHLATAVHNTRHTDLTMRTLLYLLRIHHAQVISTPSMAAVLRELHASVRSVLVTHKDQVGFNLAALKFSEAFIRDRSSVAYRALTSEKPVASSSQKVKKEHVTKQHIKKTRRG
ncbi:MAG: WD40 repeat domain-containing protein [archaeon]|nr:WD40 repeat domain-containing protein [archaeon]